MDSMLDALYGIEGQWHRPEFDIKYSGDQAIQSVMLNKTPDSATLTVVFPPWHTSALFSRRLLRHFSQYDSHVLIYHFNLLLLDSDTLNVKSSFEYIALSIAQDIGTLADQLVIQTVDLVGVSVGNVALCITAEKLKNFNHVTMIVPGNNLAASLWAGWRTRRLRNTIRAEGYKLVELEKEWADLAPDARLQMLRRHPVDIILARKDRFIPYRFGKQLYEEVHELNPQTTCMTTNMGHVATIWQYLRGATPWMIYNKNNYE